MTLISSIEELEYLIKHKSTNDFTFELTTKFPLKLKVEPKEIKEEKVEIQKPNLIEIEEQTSVTKVDNGDGTITRHFQSSLVNDLTVKKMLSKKENYDVIVKYMQDNNINEITTKQLLEIFDNDIKTIVGLCNAGYLIQIGGKYILAKID